MKFYPDEKGGGDGSENYLAIPRGGGHKKGFGVVFTW